MQSAPDDKVAEGFRVKDGNPGLALGQTGVLGYKFRGSAAATHSVVGLGREAEESIQIMGADSYMGIVRFDDLTGYYEPRRSDNQFADDYADYGLYV